MKKILLTIAAIALFAAPASAQMLSLWTDEAMTACDFYGAQYAQFPVYLMLEPGPEGAFAVEYAQYFPAGLILNVTNSSPAISVASPDPANPGSTSVAFGTCQTETFWVYNWMLFAMDPTPGYITIEPHAGTGKLIIANCDEEAGRPERPCSVYNYFGWNDACVVGTKESSWGAIKNMMD
jgi:hypothetical protein